MSLTAGFFADRIHDLEEMIDFEFTNNRFAGEALQTAGSYIPGIPAGPTGNKRLALVGDSVLRLVLTVDGYNRGLSRGAISQILTTRANNTYLADRGFLQGLERLIFTNRSQGNFVSNGVMADTVEAILGAVWMDSSEDISAVRRVMQALGLSGN